MSSQTPNLNLVLPVGTEKVSRQIINDNNTKIDTAVGSNSTAIATKQDKTMTEPGTGYIVGGVSNLNTLYDGMSNASYSICRYGANSTGAPHAGDGVVETFRNSANYGVQISSSDRGQHVRIMSAGTFRSWNELATKNDTELTVRTLTVSYSTAANGQYNTNLKTLIDADIPSGYSCVGIVGFTTNNQNVFPVAVMYYNGNYSLQLRNTSGSAVSENMTILYLTKRS